MAKGRARKEAGPSEGRVMHAGESGPVRPGRAGLGRVESAGSGRGSERERGRAVWYLRVDWAGNFNNAAEPKSCLILANCKIRHD
jgi:hypothetical protein